LYLGEVYFKNEHGKSGREKKIEIEPITCVSGGKSA
jgi:hypothetical protein